MSNDDRVDSGGLAGRYDEFYRRRDPRRVYPVEFVVRAFLGSYPRLPREGEPWIDRRVLDLGCGDGRNMPLLADLGMNVYGTEISDVVCRLTEARMKALGVAVENRVGRNASLPFDTAFFDHVLACHSCYYVEPGTRFADNVSEIARVMKPGGRFVFSAPMPSTYILEGSRDLGNGHREIVNDPYNVRSGCVFRVFEGPDDIESALGGHFEDFRIGSCRNDFWGIAEHVWIVVCWRRG